MKMLAKYGKQQKEIKIIKREGPLLQVSIGDPVEEYQTLVVLSAMKMENELKAPTNGIISKIHTQEGDVVKEGAVLVEVKSVT